MKYIWTFLFERYKDVADGRHHYGSSFYWARSFQGCWRTTRAEFVLILHDASWQLQWQTVIKTSLNGASFFLQPGFYFCTNTVITINKGLSCRINCGDLLSLLVTKLANLATSHSNVHYITKLPAPNISGGHILLCHFLKVLKLCLHTVMVSTEGQNKM